MKMVTLGKTGLRVSCAGFGVLPMGPAQLALPLEEGAALIEYALEQGFNFFDTAQYYQTYPYLRRGLERWQESHPEESLDHVVLCSKSLAETYDDMTAAIEEATQALGRPVDIFLMHEVRGSQMPQRAGAWQALVDAKARGVVKAIGLSTHHVDVVGAAAAMEALDVVFPLLNYAGLGIRCENRFATAEEMMEAIRACHQAGKAIFTMKAFGGGSLTATYQKALDYVFQQEEVHAVMVGFGKKSEIDDLLSYLDKTMDSAYNPDVSHKKIHVNQEDCEGCGACKSTCPAGAIYWNENGLADVDQSKCLTCGYCAPVCPVRAVIMY